MCAHQFSVMCASLLFETKDSRIDIRHGATHHLRSGNEFPKSYLPSYSRPWFVIGHSYYVARTFQVKKIGTKRDCPKSNLTLENCQGFILEVHQYRGRSLVSEPVKSKVVIFKGKIQVASENKRSHRIPSDGVVRCFLTFTAHDWSETSAYARAFRLVIVDDSGTEVRKWFCGGADAYQ